MTETALKQQVITYVEQLDSNKMNLALIYLRDLSESGSKQSNSKTEQERKEAAKALAELEQTNFKIKDSSLDGRKEKTEYLWRKYESLA